MARILLIGALLLWFVPAFAANDFVGGQSGNFGSGGCIVGCDDKAASQTPQTTPAPARKPSKATTSKITATAIWETVGYIFDPFLVKGALLAVEIAGLAMIGGVILGLGLGLLRLSRLRLVRGA